MPNVISVFPKSILKSHINLLPRFLLGRHKLAIEAYKQAELRSEATDWEICHNMGM